MLEIFLGVSHSHWMQISGILAFSSAFQIAVICESYLQWKSASSPLERQLHCTTVPPTAVKLQFEICYVYKCSCTEVMSLLRQVTEFSISKFSPVFLSWSYTYYFLLILFCFISVSWTLQFFFFFPVG